jgi:hypothetical protein
MEESQAYEMIHCAVFEAIEQRDFTMMALIGIIEVVKAEAMSTILEDVPEEGEEGEEGEFVEEDLAA